MKACTKLLLFVFFTLFISNAYALTPESKTAITNYLNARLTFGVEVSALQSGIDFEKVSSVFFHDIPSQHPIEACYINGIKLETFATPHCASLRDNYTVFLLKRRILIEMATTDPGLRAILDTIMR